MQIKTKRGQNEKAKLSRIINKRQRQENEREICIWWNKSLRKGCQEKDVSKKTERELAKHITNDLQRRKWTNY